MHTECQDFAVADCKENATYLPGKDLASVRHTHHWREGNLPSSSKCAQCKKGCFSVECLSGFRCEWCGMTVRNKITSWKVCRNEEASRNYEKITILPVSLCEVSSRIEVRFAPVSGDFSSVELRLSAILMFYLLSSFSSESCPLFQGYTANMHFWKSGTHLSATTCDQYPSNRSTNGSDNRGTSTAQGSTNA